MTILVYDGKTIAADRQVTAGAAIVEYKPKIYKYSKGLFACAGAVSDVPRFKSWLENGGEYPDFTKEFSAFWTVGKKVMLANSEATWEAYVPCAIGSTYGEAAAEALCRVGYTAKQAAEEVCKYDTTCGGKVDVVNVA